ncbi:hypothetical protein IHV09_20065 [Fictibacillus sp. 23RED33]|uniref:hypothetical protein n=1 Tax=Fictibacillus sp. 23RED33 TaxID=2745879 RepID=UPI0018CF6FFA|nr:hypothetical protein [Fictibacillus sp. 23RED33]MBH0175873.1 hypothetical protein [Fictibacillus sp. 23RED33]
MRKIIKDLFFVDKVKIGDEEGLILSDQNGVPVPYDQAKEIVEKLVFFYEGEGAKDFTNEEQQREKLRYYGFDFETDGIFQHRGKPVYEWKEFRRDLKRNWGFDCACCGKKVSSKMDKGYYKLNMGYRFFVGAGMGENLKSEFSCSEDCIKVVWKDVLNQWLTNEGLKKYIQ